MRGHREAQRQAIPRRVILCRLIRGFRKRILRPGGIPVKAALLGVRLTLVRERLKVVPAVPLMHRQLSHPVIDEAQAMNGSARRLGPTEHRLPEVSLLWVGLCAETVGFLSDLNGECVVSQGRVQTPLQITFAVAAIKEFPCKETSEDPTSLPSKSCS